MLCHGKLPDLDVEQPKLGGQRRERKPSCRVIRRIECMSLGLDR